MLRCRAAQTWWAQPGLLELGAVPIQPADLYQFTLKQLKPTALPIAVLAQDQVAAIGALQAGGSAIGVVAVSLEGMCAKPSGGKP